MEASKESETIVMGKLLVLQIKVLGLPKCACTQRPAAHKARAHASAGRTTVCAQGWLAINDIRWREFLAELTAEEYASAGAVVC